MRLFHDNHSVDNHPSDNRNDEANRYRNIVAALDNLIVQLGPNATMTDFNVRLRAARDVYEHEMVWHITRPALQPDPRERDLFDGHHSRDAR